MAKIEISKLPKEIKDKYSIENDSFKLSKIINPELDLYNNESKDEIKITLGDNTEGLLGGEGDFKPNIELKRWNEVSFKIKTDKLLKNVATKDKDLKFEGDKVKFKTPKMDFEMYDFTDGEGGYKYIWYLNEKPLTNKIEFEIESSGLDFFRQPPLTEEYKDGYNEEFKKEIVVSETQVKDLDGNVLVERPENVVGSYAVYHSTKGGMNDKDGKDYKTGQAFMIYRPHIIDANGAETWGILHIENGIYSVEISQDFLDKAVYPIKSNDTFGYTTIGGTLTAILSCFAMAGQVTYRHAAVTGETITKFSLAGYSSGGVTGFDMAAYTFVGDVTSARLAAGVTVTLPTDNPPTVFTDSSSVSQSLTNAVTYVVAAGNDGAASEYAAYNTGAGDQRSRDVTSGALPATWTQYDYSTSMYSIYATYTSSIEPSESVSPSASPSRSPSASPSSSPSVSPPNSYSPSVSPSISLSISPSVSLSTSISISRSPSVSPSISPSVSLSTSISISRSPSASPSISPSLSVSLSPSASISKSSSLSLSSSPSISPSSALPAQTNLQTDYWKVTFTGDTSFSTSLSPSISSSTSYSTSLSISPSISLSRSPSASISISTSISPSASLSVSSSISLSVSPSVSYSTSISVSISPSVSISVSPSRSISVSLSISPSSSISISPSRSISISLSRSPSVSPSVSFSISPSVSYSTSISVSVSPSVSISVSPSRSISISPSVSPSVSPSPSPKQRRRPKIIKYVVNKKSMIEDLNTKKIKVKLLKVNKNAIITSYTVNKAPKIEFFTKNKKSKIY